MLIAASTPAHAGLVRAAVEAGQADVRREAARLRPRRDHRARPPGGSVRARLQLGFQRRFDPAYREAKRLVETGALGDIYLVRLIAHDHTPPPDAYIAASGGLFRDSSVHDFDALRWVTGQEVVEVYATGAVRHFPAFAQHGDIDTGA